MSAKIRRKESIKDNHQMANKFAEKMEILGLLSKLSLK